MRSPSAAPAPEAWGAGAAKPAQAALGFVQLADVLEHFACGGRRFVVRGLVLGVADQAAQVLAIALGELPDEGVERASPPAINWSRQRSRAWKRSLYWRVEESTWSMRATMASTSWSRISLPMYWICRLRAMCALCFGASSSALRSGSVSGRRSSNCGCRVVRRSPRSCRACSSRLICDLLFSSNCESSS